MLKNFNIHRKGFKYLGIELITDLYGLEFRKGTIMFQISRAQLQDLFMLPDEDIEMEIIRSALKAFGLNFEDYITNLQKGLKKEQEWDNFYNENM